MSVFLVVFFVFDLDRFFARLEFGSSSRLSLGRFWRRVNDNFIRECEHGGRVEAKSLGSREPP